MSYEEELDSYIYMDLSISIPVCCFLSSSYCVFRWWEQQPSIPIHLLLDMMASEEIMQLNPFLEAKEKQIILLNYLNPEYVYPGQHPCLSWPASL